MIDREYAYIVSRTLENKIAFAENNDQKTLLVTLDVLKDILALLKEQPEIVRCRDCKYWQQLYGKESGRCVCDDMWRSLDGELAEVEDIRTYSDFYCGYADRR